MLIAQVNSLTLPFPYGHLNTMYYTMLVQRLGGVRLPFPNGDLIGGSEGWSKASPALSFL